MENVIRVEDGKYVGGAAQPVKASEVYLSDGTTSVESAITTDGS